MEIYTIGFTKKSAEEFFEILRKNGIKLVIDVRLNNTSQMAGFTKKDDLMYFVRELCGADYVHNPDLSPTQEILDGIRKKKIDWNEYETLFNQLLEERKIGETLDEELFSRPAVLLCSEATADQCHRRLVAEYLKGKWKDVTIVHL
ncbi:MAG TPA: DUF488 domain-containing protein [Firmicutes bacterium]|nr:DUF488 domain-containing protein [Bacillota bacterium]